MSEELEKSSENKPLRNEKGQLLPGNTANENGRPPETQEQKIIKKATKELIKEYKDKLAEALPFIEPKLVALAISGDIQAIKEVHDRVMGKSEQHTDITTQGQPIIQLAKEIIEKNDINISTEPNS